ncbi:MAG: hypothetical protein DRQ55_12890 [Planctomycetota bacterium]|nr:MAG: hypothetical protein DRQ55_12890 [Planctomycetota bacterium]
MSIRSTARALLLCLAPALALAPTATAQYQAAGKVTWGFDVTTSGDDVVWTSPTSVDPGATEFNSVYQLDLVEVTWAFSFLTGTLDVTDQIPPEQSQGGGASVGPAPITLLSATLVTPAPPEPPSVAADVHIGLDAGGFGSFSATNVTLGSVSVDTGLFGLVDVTITSIRVKGSLSMHATWLDLGASLAGSAGAPQLTPSGSLEANSDGQLELTNAAPDTGAFFVLSGTLLAAPFKGGLLIPFPDVFIGLPTDGAGALSVPFTWPAGIPSRAALYMQVWVPDAGGPKGFAASNGVAGLTP